MIKPTSLEVGVLDLGILYVNDEVERRMQVICDNLLEVYNFS